MGLSPKQKAFFLGKHPQLNIVTGAIRSGKSFIQDISFLDFLYEFAIDNIDILITGKKADAAERNVIKPIMREVETSFKSHEFEYKRNPRVLHYKPKNIDCYIEGAYDEGSVSRIQGMTVQAVYGNEAALYPRSFFTELMGRCSAGQRYKQFDMNPEAATHYMKTEFIDKILSGEMDGKVWEFTLDDNPSLHPDYIKQIKLAYTGAAYQRKILGKWVQSEGLCFDEFEQTRHVKPASEIEELLDNATIREFAMGVDFGYEHPMGLVLLGKDRKGIIYVIDNLKKKHQVWDNTWIQGGVKTFSRGIVARAICDSADPGAIQIGNNGHIGIRFIPCRKYPKRVNADINTINSMFKANKLIISDKCKDLIGELNSYTWKANRDGTITKDEPERTNDHVIDSFRYGLDAFQGQAEVRMI